MLDYPRSIKSGESIHVNAVLRRTTISASSMDKRLSLLRV